MLHSLLVLIDFFPTSREIRYYSPVLFEKRGHINELSERSKGRRLFGLLLFICEFQDRAGTALMRRDLLRRVLVEGFISRGRLCGLEICR